MPSLRRLDLGGAGNIPSGRDAPNWPPASAFAAAPRLRLPKGVMGMGCKRVSLELQHMGSECHVLVEIFKH